MKEFHILILSLALLLVNASPPLFYEEPENYFTSAVPRFNRAKNSNFRLPNSVIPIHYDVSLIPILDESENSFTCPGELTILVNCTESTSLIVLHSLAIDIDFVSTEITAVSDETIIPVTDQKYNGENESFEIVLEQNLVAGQEYKIYLKFVSEVNGIHLGLYRSSYVHTDGNTRWLAATQLQDKHARRVFPNFDEPAMKATFTISLGRNERHTTLCNMEKKGNPEPIEGRDGWFWDHYEETPIMSSYLLAIIVSDFDYVEAKIDYYGKPVISWATPQQISEGAGDYSTDLSVRNLQYFDQHLDLLYPLKKLDSISVPDFLYGAMENWGLVLYRETALLVYPGISTELERKRVTYVISHELAHFWFGNIVTCGWWNHIWLNEGFANHYEYLAMAELVPEYPIVALITDSVHTALRFDSGPNSVAVVSDESAPSTIIYDKGAALIHMMKGMISETTFLTAIRKYLKDNSYGNTYQDQLFEELTTQAHADQKLNETLDMKEIMDTWTLQAGYPLVRCGRASHDRIFVSQEKYSHMPKATRDLNPSEMWWVPISYATKGDPNFSEDNQLPKVWIPKNVAMKIIEVENADEWIILNTGHRGFYRVLYDQHFTNLIVEQLDSDHKVIDSLSRGQLLHDCFSFAFAKYTTVSYAMQFTKYLTQEDEWVSWIPMLINLRTSYNMLSGHAGFSAFKEYFMPRLGGALDLIGFEQTPDSKGHNAILRSQLLDMACGLGLPKCYEYANKLHDEWESPTENPIPVDIRQVMYCAITAGVTDGHVFALNKYQTETNAVQKGFWRNALSCSTDEGILRDLMTKAIEPSTIAKADAIELLRRITLNSAARSDMLAFMKDNIDTLISYFEGGSGISNIIAAYAQVCSSQDQHDEIEAFFNENEAKLSDVAGSIRSSLVAIRLNIEWMDHFGLEMIEWMENYLETHQ